MAPAFTRDCATLPRGTTRDCAALTRVCDSDCGILFRSVHGASAEIGAPICCCCRHQAAIATAGEHGKKTKVSRARYVARPRCGCNMPIKRASRHSRYLACVPCARAVRSCLLRLLRVCVPLASRATCILHPLRVRVPCLAASCVSWTRCARVHGARGAGLRAEWSLPRADTHAHTWCHPQLHGEYTARSGFNGGDHAQVGHAIFRPAGARRRRGACNRIA